MKDPDVAIVVAASIARLSGVLMITFGLKLLLNLYSYHVRVAAFIAARRKALRTIGSDSLKDLEHLVRILSPENITFDKPPDALDVNEVLKALLGVKKD